MLSFSRSQAKRTGHREIQDVALYDFSLVDTVVHSGPTFVFEEGVWPMQESMKLLGYGVDILIPNMRYADSNGQPVKQEID